MHVKKGDKVQVIAGKDKGKQGVVSVSLPKQQKVVIEGVNIVKKHQKPSNANPNGGIVEMEAPIHVSNVLHVDPKTNKPTRVGYKFVTDKDGNIEMNKSGRPVKVRYAKKSGELID